MGSNTGAVCLVEENKTMCCDSTARETHCAVMLSQKIISLVLAAQQQIVIIQTYSRDKTMFFDHHITGFDCEFILMLH